MSIPPPTLAQQRGLAYAPIPFAIISFVSSSYVIYFILRNETQRLQRMYHRLVLALNVALLPLTFIYIWSTSAVPEGTPNYVGASGTQGTCTASGFIWLVCFMAVAIYYGSLILQAFMGIKHNFKEEKYRWIEKYIHLFAFLFPLALSTGVAVTENFNPWGSGCAITKAPLGCENDPDVPCERGEDIQVLIYIFGFSQMFLWVIYPPSMSIGMYCWIRKIQVKINKSVGMQQVRESARKKMLQSIAMQISLYLFSFWTTFLPSLIIWVHHTWGLNIFANCIFALQGFIMAVVYFVLPRLGTSKPDLNAVQSMVSSSRQGGRHELTVEDIRSNVQSKSEMASEVASEHEGRLGSDDFVFNIFDGVPDEDSPWAKFIDCDDDDSSTSE